MTKFRLKFGMSLIEIVLAVSLLAVSFIPIMSLLGSNLKITERDKANILAMNLCQDRLNKAIALDYNQFDANLDTPIDADLGYIDLSPYTAEDGTVFNFELTVKKQTVKFNVMKRDYASEAEGVKAKDYKWMKVPEQTFDDKVRMYKMRVWWQGKVDANGKVVGPEHKKIIKDYTLVTYKAKLK